ncbi:DUF4439 domain-containing protein [uncultured Corynebacterium sp.]|uniref:DUF4439 domain-containing protein n=1 Tax=uncultured Corynebacterium sp. TaxID=159447 RepID=UPI0025F744A1|nr:DUF4439 domain-containing protein [uncultured Corynebacterium sp.]
MMSKHVPSPAATVRFSAVAAEQPRPLRVGRRGFLLAGLATAGALGLNACSTDGGSLTEVFAAAPQPDEQLVDFYWALKDAAEAASKNKNSEFTAPAKAYEEQAAVLAKEISRQCGHDDEGNAPEKCTATTTEPPRPAAEPLNSDSELRDKALGVISSVADETVAGLVTGMYAALAVAANAAELDKAQRLDEKAVAAGFGGADSEGLKGLVSAVDMAYGAIYVSGLALAADGGPNRETLRAVADRLRDFREATRGVIEESGATMPVPQASYTSPSGAPKNSSSALSTQLEVTQPITKQLRFVVTKTAQPEAREFAARWCGLVARLEAAIERAQGEDPLTRATRG